MHASRRRLEARQGELEQAVGQRRWWNVATRTLRPSPPLCGRYCQGMVEAVRSLCETCARVREDRRRTAEAGFDHHLMKPPEPQAVEAVLAALPK